MLIKVHRLRDKILFGCKMLGHKSVCTELPKGSPSVKLKSMYYEKVYSSAIVTKFRVTQIKLF